MLEKLKQKIVRKLMFTWYYTTNPSFRWWIDFNAIQKYHDHAYNCMVDRKRHEAKEEFELKHPNVKL